MIDGVWMQASIRAGRCLVCGWPIFCIPSETPSMALWFHVRHAIEGQRRRDLETIVPGAGGVGSAIAGLRS
jgi:hypothetical protein